MPRYAFRCKNRECRHELDSAETGPKCPRCGQRTERRFEVQFPKPREITPKRRTRPEVPADAAPARDIIALSNVEFIAESGQRTTGVKMDERTELHGEGLKFRGLKTGVDNDGGVFDAPDSEFE